MKRTILLIFSLCIMTITLGCGSKDSYAYRANKTNKSEKSSRVSSEGKSKK